ncbi:MAG: P-loop NTPase, partial [Pseudomonadota bacterium]
MEADRQAVLEQLKKVKGPDLDSNLVDLGLVSEIFVADSKVYFSITVPAERAKELEPLREAAEKAVGEIDGVEKVVVSLTAAKKPGSGEKANEPPQRQSAPKGTQPGVIPPQMRGQGPGGGGQGMPEKLGIPGIESIIAVASGKGGVGKSTTAVNLALALQANGLKVGVLDADIYGPSIPRLLHITGKPQTIKGRTLRPMDGYGMKVMSMGFLVDEETPMIWRGPMVISALTQMLREVEWGKLDVLVV